MAIETVAFQSSPARGGGCNFALDAEFNEVYGFQSSPARGGGCNRRCEPIDLAAREGVSILTRPWGRVQLSCWDCTMVLAVFQSSPARGGGCNSHIRAAAATHLAVSILTRPWGRVQRYWLYS